MSKLKKNNERYTPCKYCGVLVRKRIIIGRGNSVQEYLVEKFPPFAWRKHKCQKKQTSEKK
jgi:hypothetical protein